MQNEEKMLDPKNKAMRQTAEPKNTANSKVLTANAGRTRSESNSKKQIFIIDQEMQGINVRPSHQRKDT